MGAAHKLSHAILTPFEQLRYAREVIQLEAQAVEQLASRLDTDFCRAADQIHLCNGNLIICGIGKAGLIGQKLTATFSSTGTRAHFLHPAEAIHGDLGRVHASDLLLVLSQSGETEEITRLLPSLAEMNVRIIAITARRKSTLGKAAAITLEIGQLREACEHGLAPSATTTAMLALGDALALVVSRMRGFGREDFARFHPGGALGRKLAKVQDVMRPLVDCRIARCSQTVREIFAMTRMPRRRTGAIMIVDPQGILRGIFTDSDLARLFESRNDSMIDDSIRTVMTKRPRSVTYGAPLNDALEILSERKISELPVVDVDGRPIGMIDITDVIGMFPEKAALGQDDEPHEMSASTTTSMLVTSVIPIDGPDLTYSTTIDSHQPLHPHQSAQFSNSSPHTVNVHPGLSPDFPSQSVPRPNSPGFFGNTRTPTREST